MKVLSSLTKKYLSLNKKRTIVTIIGIILSCALIGGVANLVTSFQRFIIDTSIEEFGPQHVTFVDLDKDNVKYIEHNANTKSTYSVASLGYTRLDQSTNEIKPILQIVAFDEEAFKYNVFKLKEGRLPKNSSEIVISEFIKNEGGFDFKIGDVITSKVGDINKEVLEEGDATIDVKYEKEYTIVGIIDRFNFYPFANMSSPFVTHLDDDLLFNINTINLSVIVKKPKNTYDDIKDIAKKLNIENKKIEYNDNLLRWYGATGTDNGNKFLYTMALILITVIMVASIIVIYNSFIISITERKKQFGMLSSIGATPKQLRSMVLKEGLILSIIGIPLGILFSILGIGITLKVVNGLGVFDGFYDSTLHLVVSYPAILVTILFSSLTIFLSSLIPAIKASRTSPITAIRLTQDIKIKGRKVRTSKLTRLIFGIEGELGLKNMKRNKKKYRSTIISIFVSIVLFMTISGFANYSFKSALRVYNKLNYNVAIYNENIDQAFSKETDDLYNTIVKMPYVKEYSIVKSLYFEIKLDKKDINTKMINNLLCDDKTNKCKVPITLSTLGEHEFKKYIDKNNLNIKDFDNATPKVIFIKNTVYRDYKESKIYNVSLIRQKVGDSLDLYDTEGNKTSEVTIGAYSEIYPVGFSDGMVANNGLQGFITDEFANTFDRKLLNYNYLIMYSDKPNELIKEVKNITKDNDNIQIIDINEELKQVKNIILTIDIFLYGFIILVSLITVTNIINTITTSIYLRRREFAMIKAVGMTDKAFRKMIAYESIFYGIKGIVYGLPFGIFMDYFLYKNVNSVFVYDYTLPYKSILISIIFVFVIISITMLYSVRKIKNDNIVDIIKQENL